MLEQINYCQKLFACCSNAEIVKECMIVDILVLMPDNNSLQAIKQVPLSDITASRRADHLAQNAFIN